MSKDRINVTKSSMPTIEEYIEELQPVWNSRWLSNRGEASKKLERELKDYLNTDNIWLFANGHLALEVSIGAFDFPEDSEVITTPYTHCSTTHSITRNGLRPVLVDIKEDCTINADLIEDSISDKTVAIVATHVYGFMCDVDKIEKIAKKHKLKVIYDAAHAFGVEYNGISAANYGDLAMFSTHATKVFHTIEGGFCTFRDPEMRRKLSHNVNFGFDGPEQVEYIGTNARMNEFEAVMGIVNLRHIDEEIEKRKRATLRYWERLDGIKGIKSIKPGKNIKWNYSYLPVIFDGYKEDRNAIQEKLGKENVFARKYFYPIISELKCYENWFDVDVPVAKHTSEAVLTLPLYADLNIEDVDRICDVILS